MPAPSAKSDLIHLLRFQVKRKNFGNVLVVCHIGIAAREIDELYIMICCYSNRLPSVWETVFHHYHTGNAWTVANANTKGFL